MRGVAEAGERGELGRACFGLGTCSMMEREFGKAVVLLEQARVIMQELGGCDGLWRAYNNLGHCYRSMGEHGKELALLVQYREAAGALGDRAGVGRAWPAAASWLPPPWLAARWSSAC